MTTLRELKAEITPIFASFGGNPRVHPNGFIQLDLEPVPESWHASHQRGHSGASRRLHIWNPTGIELPRQDTVNEIHDHVFDMQSEVVSGALWQVLYELRDARGRSVEPTHEAYEAVYEKSSDSRLRPTGLVGELVEVERFKVGHGKTYIQPAFTLHNSVPEGSPVVTVMTKTAIHDGDATVICLIDQPPDNDFDRASAAPVDEIWQAIWDSLKPIV